MRKITTGNYTIVDLAMMIACNQIDRRLIHEGYEYDVKDIIMGIWGTNGKTKEPVWIEGKFYVLARVNPNDKTPVIVYIHEKPYKEQYLNGRL